MHIDPQRLRLLRRRNQLTIEQLAEKSQVSDRTLYRLESGSSSVRNTRERTVLQISKALGIEVDVLTGDQSLPDAVQFDPRIPSSPVRVNIRMLPETRLAAELVARRYRVRPAVLFNIAPLLFTLVAEGSLQWRREKLKSAAEAVHQLQSLGGCEHVSRVAFVGAGRVEEHLFYERESIEKEDLFGSEIGYDHYDLGYDQDETNPFADYLGELIEKLGLLRSGKVEFPGGIETGLLENVPASNILPEDLNWITQSDVRAEWSLARGYARIADIPKEFMTEESSDERVRWLQSRVPDDHPASYSEALDRLSDNFDLGHLFESTASSSTDQKRDEES